MTPQITPYDIAIITKDNVAKTFSGIDCRVLRRIEFIQNNYGASSRTYKVRTDLVRYEESEELVYDDENKGSILPKQRLVVMEQREDWTAKTYTRGQINALAVELAQLLPEDLERYDKDIKELQLGLLMLTKQEAAWGIAADQWQLFNKEDLIIDTE